MNTRFIDNGDLTVTDQVTGLTWLKHANYFEKAMKWAEAVKVCAKLNVAGRQWRLPERLELDSLLDLSRFCPALPEEHPFINVQAAYYWSATAYASDPNRVWMVDIYVYGCIDHWRKKSLGYAWPVCRVCYY